MSVLRAPGLRIELATDGERERLVMFDTKETKTEIPCSLSAKASEHRENLKSSLDQLKDSVRKENLTLKDTSKALDEFNFKGISLTYRIFDNSTDNCEKVVKIFQSCFRTWRTQHEPAVITITTQLGRFMPLEFLPLFELSEWPKLDDRKSLEANVRRFPGFSAIIRHEFPDLRVSQNLVLENDPKLPLKCFYNRGLEGAAPEIDFFERNAGERGCLDFDGPWPKREYDERREFSKSLARHLRYGDRRFDGKYRGTMDQVQHFVCHCEINEKESSKSRLLFSDRKNIASIADLQADFVILKKKPKSKDGPLVFLNACGTSRIDPMAVTSFPRFFLKDNFNRGFIGTETNVPDAFAADFSQSFYRGLLKGLGVGQALYNAKWEMLRKKNNPLGMLYVVYADPDLHVSKRVKNVN